MGQGITSDNQFPDPASEFALQQQQLERRRQLARAMIASGMEGNTGSGYHGGRVFIVGNPLGNIANAVGGAYLDSKANSEANDLAARQAAAQNDWQTEFNASTDPAEQQRLLTTARNRGLRYDLEKGFAEQEAQRVERGEQLAASRVETAAEKEANRQFLEEQKRLDRQNRLDAKAMPSVHVSVGGGGKGGIKAPSGYRYNEDGTALEPIPGGPHDVAGKPTKLTAAQQKAYDDSDVLLGHIDNALGAIKANPDALGKKTIIPDMALATVNPEGVMTRAAVAGLSAEKVHQLSGAAVSPAEFARLRPYLPSSGDSAKVAEDKLTNLRKEVERIKVAHARGPTMANPNAKPSIAPNVAATVVRTGKDANGRKVEQMSDGTVRYAQ